MPEFRTVDVGELSLRCAIEGAGPLVVMVHGSPSSAANDDMFRVVEIIRERKDFDIVEVGFMECNQPTIDAALDDAVDQGATRVVAVPYFLHTGTHVADDLPGILDDAHGRHPKVEFAMGKYLGSSPRLTEILADRARSATK